MADPKLAHLSPASAGGILFQAQRVLLNLVENASATKVGFELFDDVAMVLSDGTLCVEQDKFSAALSTLTDECEQTWKTLSNWMDALAAADPTQRSNYRFFFVTNLPLPPTPSFTTRLGRPDKNPAEVDTCLHEMATIAARRAQRRQARPPKTPGPTNGAPAAHDYVEQVMKGPADIRRMVVANTSFTFGSNPVNTSQRQAVLHKLFLTSAENGDALWNQLLGWTNLRLLDSIERRVDCWIERSDFNQALLEARRSLGANLSSRRLRPAMMIPASETQAVRAPAPPNGTASYEERLLEVGLDGEVLSEATEAYLRHKAELLYLAKTGAIIEDYSNRVESDSYGFYCTLCDRWRWVYTRARRLAATKPQHEVGQSVYFETVESATGTVLTIGRVSIDQPYFVHGGYHVLANKEVSGAEVWWRADLPPPTHTPVKQ